MSTYKIEVSLYGSCGTIQLEALTVNWRNHKNEHMLEFQPLGITDAMRTDLNDYETAQDRSIEVKITKPHETQIIGAREVTHVSSSTINNLPRIILHVSEFESSQWFDINK